MESISHQGTEEYKFRVKTKNGTKTFATPIQRISPTSPKSDRLGENEAFLDILYTLVYILRQTAHSPARLRAKRKYKRIVELFIVMYFGVRPSLSLLCLYIIIQYQPARFHYRNGTSPSRAL